MTTTLSKPLVLGHFLVAGASCIPAVTFSGLLLHPQTPIRLRREPYNPHDPLCVGVETAAGKPLGYLRRADNRIPAALLDQGAPLHARIAELDLHPDGTPREFRIEITLGNKPSPMEEETREPAAE